MAKIAVDAGHGLYTPGKRCLKSLDPNETREWVLNDRVADSVVSYLQSAGHEVIRVDDPTGKTDISLGNRCRTANNWKADAYVSVHHNAGANGTSAGGLVVYVGTGEQPKSTKIQEAIYRHAVEDIDGVKGNRYDGTLSAAFYVLMNTNMPAVLVECGFMDSTVDIKNVLNPEWSKKMGREIAEGVCEIYGGTIKTSEPEKKARQLPGNAVNNFGLKYQSHIQSLGWLDPVHDGQISGTTGYGLRLEAIRFTDLAGLKIKAVAHIQGIGDVDYGYITTETIIGTTGQGKRLEALRLQIEGAEGKDIYLQFHFHHDGWGSTVKGASGTYGLSKEVQAVKIWIA